MIVNLVCGYPVITFVCRRMAVSRRALLCGSFCLCERLVCECDSLMCVLELFVCAFGISDLDHEWFWLIDDDEEESKRKVGATFRSPLLCLCGRLSKSQPMRLCGQLVLSHLDLIVCGHIPYGDVHRLCLSVCECDHFKVLISIMEFILKCGGPNDKRKENKRTDSHTRSI